MLARAVRRVVEQAAKHVAEPYRKAQPRSNMVLHV